MRIDLREEDCLGIRMKTLLTVIGLITIGLSASAQQRLVLEGHYQGKNLFVQNPYNDGGVGFCADKVTVNGDVTSDEINSSAFEIDFAKLGLKNGDAVSVVIEHSSDCAPKVLNSEILKPTSNCTYNSVELSTSGLLKWSTTGETGKLPFIVEIYNWNKWIPIGEVDGKGTSGTHNYEFQLTMHSGTMKARLKQIDHTKKPNSSQPKSVNSPKAEVTFEPKKVGKEILLSSKTRYEIYDAYGNLVKKGYGDNISCTNLEKGVYYLNYDNKGEKFLKK